MSFYRSGGSREGAVQIDRHKLQIYHDVWKQYNKDIANYIRLHVPKADLEDLLQEVFLALYAKMDSGEEIQNYRAWLYQTTRNQCSSKLEKIKRHRKVISIDDEEWQDYEPAEECRELLFPPVSEQQINEWIASILKQLTAEEQMIMEDAYLHKIAPRQIAKNWGLSEAAVYQRLQRLRMKIRRLAKDLTKDYDW